MGEELTEEQKKEADEFIDGLFTAVLASAGFMKMIVENLELINRRLATIELALTNDNGMGRA